MLLVIDVGNTNITMGVFEGEELVCDFRITTISTRTADEYGLLLLDFMKVCKVDLGDIDSVVLSTVVPKILRSLRSSIIKYIDVNPLIIGAGTKTGIKITSENPKEIGADRIVDAVAGLNIYGGPVLVVDFGTASTYDLITKDGEFLAGVTSPGIQISANALWSETAKLPEIEIMKPASILSKETISSMQAGLIYGCIGATEYIIKKMKEESGLLDATVVATGGLGRIISDSTDSIDIYDQNLTLKGLRIIGERNKAPRRN